MERWIARRLPPERSTGLHRAAGFLEEMVVEAFREVLGASEEVGPRANFSPLGGSSLQADGGGGAHQ